MRVTSLDATLRAVRDEVASQRFCSGAQITVFHRGRRIIDDAFGTDGRGRDTTTSSLFALYCTVKPLTALVVAMLVDRGEVSVSDRLGDILDGLRPATADLRIGELLAHDAGLPVPQATAISLLTPSRRREVVLAAEPMARRGGAGTSIYSEFAAWELLACAIEALTGETAAHLIRTWILEPLGIADDVFLGMADGDLAQVNQRVGVNLDRRGDRMVPLLLELSERILRDTNVGYGGYATTGGLAVLYQALLDCLAGRDQALALSPATLAEFVRTQRPRTFDPVMDRTCAFGFGFMTELADHHFSPCCSAATFGHAGLTGATAVFADPRAELVAAVTMNGIVRTAQDMTERRRAIIDAVYADAGR